MRAATTRLRDESWQRLPWLVPLAVALTIVSQMGFLSLLRLPADPSGPPRQVDVQVLELSASVDPPLPRPVSPPARNVPPPKPPLLEQAPARATPPPPAAPVDTPTPPSPAAVESPASPPSPTAATIPVAPGFPSSPSVPVMPNAPAAPSGPPPVAALPPSSATRGVSGGTDSMSARAIYRPMPEIPESLRRRNVELVAVARFRVTATGTATVELVEPTSDADSTTRCSRRSGGGASSRPRRPASP